MSRAPLTLKKYARSNEIKPENAKKNKINNNNQINEVSQ